MKHFIVEITYKVTFEELQGTLAAHRSFLDEGYEKGLLLMSGPQNPKVGGMVVARAETLEEIQEYFSRDPYQKGGFASYRFIEFTPVKNNPMIKDWLG
ncbi:MAG: hypothetical protein HY959_05705 [Ignavibacteriae bacterium]|nr:hypothetical protein [Ignavibacteriota bacterium]